MKQKIEMVSLLGASACNLGCSFCYLGKNPYFQKYDKIVAEAWKTGEYIETVKKVLDSLESDPNNIVEIQLWGGEPTLHFDLIAKQAKKLGSTFPNVKTIHLPTNFYKLDTDAFVEFSYGLDETINPPKEKESPLCIHLQPSIDGPPGDLNTYGHSVSWDQYKQNINNLVESFKKINKPLKNTVLDFAICPCSSQDMILNNLSTYEQIKEFRLFYNDFFTFLKEQFAQIPEIQFQVSTRYITPRIAIPQETTTEEALKINDLVRLLDLGDYNLLTNSLEIPGQAYFYRDCHGAYSIYQRNHECYESNESCITLLPDGTICECPCTFFHNEPEFQQHYLNNNDYWGYKSCLIRTNSFYNPLKGKDTEWEKDHDWYVYGGGYLGTSSTYDCLNYNMALELAMSWQIDHNYALNQELLFKHYKADFMTTECYRENINVTHNPLITDLNQFRRWFNGTTAYSYNFFLNQLLKVIEMETK